MAQSSNDPRGPSRGPQPPARPTLLDEARQGSRAESGWIVLADHGALVGLALGLALYAMPFWREGRLRIALWLTLLSTLLHVFTSRKRSSVENDHP